MKPNFKWSQPPINALHQNLIGIIFGFVTSIKFPLPRWHSASLLLPTRCLWQLCLQTLLSWQTGYKRNANEGPNCLHMANTRLWCLFLIKHMLNLEQCICIHHIHVPLNWKWMHHRAHHMMKRRHHCALSGGLWVQMPHNTSDKIWFHIQLVSYPLTIPFNSQSNNHSIQQSVK